MFTIKSLSYSTNIVLKQIMPVFTSCNIDKKLFYTYVVDYLCRHIPSTIVITRNKRLNTIKLQYDAIFNLKSI